VFPKLGPPFLIYTAHLKLTEIGNTFYWPWGCGYAKWAWSCSD